MYADFTSKELEQRRHLGTKWMSDLEAGNERRLGGQEPELRELRDFAQRYLAWVEEIQRISGVDLFKIGPRETDDGLGAVDGGATLPYSYHEIMTRLNKAPAIDQATGTGWYVHAMSHAVQSFCAANYQAWWRQS